YTLGVAFEHQEVLARFVVRTGEVDDLLARVVDRVGRDDQVDLALLDERLAVGGDRLDPLDVAGVNAKLRSDHLADLHVETDRVAIEAQEAEQRLVELRADRDLAGLIELR